MRIAFLVGDLSSNAAGRAYVLARACRPFAEATLWGPASKGVPWAPLASGEFPQRPIEVRDFPSFGQDARATAKKIAAEADLVFPVKPLRVSYGVARVARRRHGRPLVLDIDDWELGFLLSGGVKWKIWADGLLHWRRNGSYFPTLRLERLARREPFKTVTNTFLQERFGGTLVPSGRDPDELDPARFPSTAAKRAFGLEGLRVVLFFGTPRPHKGLEELVDAVSGLRDEDVVCVIAGSPPGDPYAQSLVGRAPGRVRLLGEQPWSRVGEVVSMADVYAVPQRAGVGTLGQMPAKVYDAMAMARPIVATDVGDLPRTLADGCGLVVPPQDPQALRRALVTLLEDPKQAAAMGQRARKRLQQSFSIDAMTRRLRPLLEEAAA